jgi:hypothetical protein
MNFRYRQHGITISGLLYACIILGSIALMLMKLFPLYNEKTKVDFALEKVASQKESARMTKAQIVKLIGRQFEVSDIDRWGIQEFGKLLKIQKLKGGKGKVMSLEYEIRGPFFGELDIVLKYNNSLKLGEPVTD